jgi:hypothetical protein
MHKNRYNPDEKGIIAVFVRGCDRHDTIRVAANWHMSFEVAIGQK